MTGFTRNDALHAKLDAQLQARELIGGATPECLFLSHDEIDEWRNQWSGGAPIPVASLAYRDIPIREAA